MTLLADGYFDWAWRLECDLRLIRDGGKLIEARPNSMEFILGHSLEGHVWITAEIRALAGKGPQNCTPAERTRVILALNAAYWAWRDADRPTTAWHVTNLRGVLAIVQHAPFHVRLAHGHAANPRAPGVEHEGVVGTPIDEYQEASSLRITRDAEEAYGRKLEWGQHNQYGPTACPSNRLARLLAALAKAIQEVEMSSAEYIELKAGLDRLTAVTVGDEARLAALAQFKPVEWRVDRMERADGWLSIALNLLAQRVEKLEAEVASGVPGASAQLAALEAEVAGILARVAAIHQATAA